MNQPFSSFIWERLFVKEILVSLCFARVMKDSADLGAVGARDFEQMLSRFRPCALSVISRCAQAFMTVPAKYRSSGARQKKKSAHISCRVDTKGCGTKQTHLRTVLIWNFLSIGKYKWIRFHVSLSWHRLTLKFQ